LQPSSSSLRMKRGRSLFAPPRYNALLSCHFCITEQVFAVVTPCIPVREVLDPYFGPNAGYRG
jgi:hypothetical protein